MKVQAHAFHRWSAIRTRRLRRITVGYDLLSQLVSYRNIVYFQIVLERKAVNEILIKISVVIKVISKFSLLDAEVKSSGLLNR